MKIASSGRTARSSGCWWIREVRVVEDIQELAAKPVPLGTVAVAEKLSALRTEQYFQERSARGKIDRARRILKRAGRRNPPVPGDEL